MLQGISPVAVLDVFLHESQHASALVWMLLDPAFTRVPLKRASACQTHSVPAQPPGVSPSPHAEGSSAVSWQQTSSGGLCWSDTRWILRVALRLQEPDPKFCARLTNAARSGDRCGMLASTACGLL